MPIVTEPGLDEVQAGDLDGKPMQAYWDWLAQHTAVDRLPHGESLLNALRRYAEALSRLLAREVPVTLVVTHELALRSIVQAAAPDLLTLPGSDLANAVPYLFDERAVRRAVLGLTARQDLPGGSRAEDAASGHPTGR